MFKELLYILGLGEVVAGCGHKTKITRKVKVINEKGMTEFTTIENVLRPNLCNDCIEKKIIRCAWCGGYILPANEPITLFIPNKDFKVPEYAVRWDKNPLYLIGCSRPKCCTNEHDLAGWWTDLGKIQRITAPINHNYDYPKNSDPRRLRSIED